MKMYLVRVRVRVIGLGLGLWLGSGQGLGGRGSGLGLGLGPGLELRDVRREEAVRARQGDGGLELRKQLVHRGRDGHAWLGHG